jgi:Lon protease-like protein
MSRRQLAKRLPLFPLPDLVHFPRTELRLHVFEPRYRQMVRDLAGVEETGRWIGMVLLRPDARGDEPGHPAIFPAGTAARVLSIEALPDGRSNLVLRGEFRFQVEFEFGQRVYRQAQVRALEDGEVDEHDGRIVALRHELLAGARRVAREMEGRFPLPGEELEELAGEVAFEELTNRLAAGLDLPPLRKLQLLEEPIDERAASLLGILRARLRVLDLLRPFRRLAGASERN